MDQDLWKIYSLIYHYTLLRIHGVLYFVLCNGSTTQTCLKQNSIFTDLKTKLRGFTIQCAAGDEPKMRSAAWENVNIPSLITIGFAHMW